MTRIRSGTGSLDLSERDFLNLVRLAVAGTYEFAHMLCSDHTQGRPGILEAAWFRPGLWNEVKQELAATVTDDQLRTALFALKEQAERLGDLDKTMVEWLAKYFDMPSSATKRSLWRLKRRYEKELAEAQKMPGPLRWLREPEFQALVMKSIRILRSIERIKRQVERRAGKLFEALGEVMIQPPQPLVYVIPQEWVNATFVRELRRWPPLPRQSAKRSKNSPAS